MTKLEALIPIAKNSRRVAVLHYTSDTVATATVFAASGAQVEIFAAPVEIAGEMGPKLRFLPHSLADSLASYDTMFNEAAYIANNPDVASSVADGIFQSGYEHYNLFGQHEGRQPGSTYYGGLAEYDTVVFDAQGWSEAESLLGGRLLAHQKVIVCDPTGVLADRDRPRLHCLPGNTLAVAYTPPTEWLGPPKPALNRWVLGNWPRLQRSDVFPPLRPDGSAWPRISIVTPSFNQGAYLDETLRSLVQQGYPNLEVIVVDGGSTDGSVDVIRRYESHLAHWESGPDRGQSHALNKGFRRATGDILSWLNSDDRLAPGALFVVAEAFLRHRPDLVAGRCARFNDRDQVPYHFHRCRFPVGQVAALSLENLLDLDGSWMRGDFFHQPEVFFTRAIWEKAGGELREDLFYSMDYDLWVRMAKAGARLLPIPEVVALFRQHARQKTGGNDLPFLPELRRVNQEFLAAPSA